MRRGRSQWIAGEACDSFVWVLLMPALFRFALRVVSAGLRIASRAGRHSGAARRQGVRRGRGRCLAHSRRPGQRAFQASNNCECTRANARNPTAVAAGRGPWPLLLHLSFHARRCCQQSSAGAGPPWRRRLMRLAGCGFGVSSCCFAFDLAAWSAWRRPQADSLTFPDLRSGHGHRIVGEVGYFCLGLF